ncbi:MAG: hypothetical protein ACXU9U_00280 [Parachlamydiaceae bacterium]
MNPCGKFILAFLAFVAFLPLSSEMTSEGKAFYAISSLRFFVDSKLNGTPGEALFEKEDISQLWSKAIDYSTSESVMHAKNLYDQAQEEGETLEAENYLARSRSFLRKAWEDLNPYLSRDQTPVTRKTYDHRTFLLSPNNRNYKELSRIFSSEDVLNTSQSFAQAGFETISERPSGMFVAKHPRLPGYLVKAYIKSKKTKPNWEWCVFRCWGVTNIRLLIEDKDLKHFVVPKKKIFPIEPLDYNNLTNNLIEMTSPVVLLVRDMQLVSKTESRAAWREIPTKRHIEELYCILSHGYSSCCLPSNIPQTRKGKFSCIDTEIPERDLPFDHVGRFLSPEMADYWNHLVRTGGERSSL